MGTEEAERPFPLAGPCSPQSWDGIWGTKQGSLPQDTASCVGAESEVGAARGAGNQALNCGVKLGHSTCLIHGLSHCAGVLVKASCAMMWGRSIAMHKIKLRWLSTYFNFLSYVSLQFPTIFHLIFLYMAYDFCPPLSQCFVPSGICRMLFSQEP